MIGHRNNTIFNRLLFHWHLLLLFSIGSPSRLKVLLLVIIESGSDCGISIPTPQISYSVDNERRERNDGSWRLNLFKLDRKLLRWIVRAREKSRETHQGRKRAEKRRRAIMPIANETRRVNTSCFHRTVTHLGTHYFRLRRRVPERIARINIEWKFVGRPNN